MHMNRLDRLIEQASAHGLDVLALVPGPNLFYLTGLSFHLSERPVVALFPVGGTPAIVLPALEAAKVAHATVGLEPFPYTDEDGHTPAFQRACAALELADCIVGVEALQMRLLEVRLLERYAPGCRLVPAEEPLAELRIRKDERELEQMRRAVAVTEAALRMTMRQVRAGMTEREIASLLTVELLRAGVPAGGVDRAARAVIEEAGYGEYFIHRTGHGLGLEVHEPPYIVAGNERLLEPGMTFTVEPGVYLPGRGGVRIEDDVLVTSDGAESLTAFPRELVSL